MATSVQMEILIREQVALWARPQLLAVGRLGGFTQAHGGNVCSQADLTLSLRISEVMGVGQFYRKRLICP